MDGPKSEPKLLGLIRDMDLGGRCAFDFLITINLTKEEVLKRYYTYSHLPNNCAADLIIFSGKKHIPTCRF